MGKRTEGNLPPEVVLEANQVYLWQVTVTIQGIETKSAYTWFSILSTDDAAEVANIERQHSDSALILLSAYER